VTYVGTAADRRIGNRQDRQRRVCACDTLRCGRQTDGLPSLWGHRRGCRV